MNDRLITAVVAGAAGALVGIPAVLLAVTLPHTFTNGTVADADQINANFQALAAAVGSAGGGVPTDSDVAACTTSNLGTLRYHVANDEVQACHALGGTPAWVVVSTGCSPGSETFTYTGGAQTFTVPQGCGTVRVKVWGAGGAGGYNGGAGVRSGGPGGFTTADVQVTGGEALTIVVGQAGQRNTSTSVGTDAPAAYGGGGAPESGGFFCAVGGGGGYSGIFRGSVSTANALVIAGGGGGASGYTDGGSGNDPVNGGGASPLQGANGSGAWGGAGGGGYEGGSLHVRGTNNGQYEGGNGGSGFASGLGVSNGSLQFSPEFTGTPPGTTDEDYVAGVGTGTGGGNYGANCDASGDGAVVITWGD
jgi:hypothetical protein